MSLANIRPLATATLLALTTFSLPAAATSLEACLNDLAQYPPAEVAQGYAARLKTEKMPREAAFWSHYCVGRAWETAGEFKQALPALRAAAKLAKSANERSSVQSFLGSTLSAMNRLDEAETAYQAALAAAREMGAAREQASELNNLGGIAYQRKQYDNALSLYTRSLRLQNNENEQATVLNNMANVHSQKGEYALAADLYQQAIAIDRRLGDQRGLAILLLNLGNTYRQLRQLKNCGTTLDEGLALARANGDRYWEGMGLMYWGWAFQDDNQPAKARENLHAALKIFKEIGAAGKVAEVEQSLAEMGR